jgi:hypothetical protein
MHRRDSGEKFIAPLVIVLILGLMAMLLPSSHLHILSLIGII